MPGISVPRMPPSTAPGPRCSVLGEFGFGAEVQQHRRDPVVEGGVEVVVEVAAVRGVPGERPAHPLPVRGELLVRRSGHRDQRRVADVQLPQPADPVGGGGAASAAVSRGRSAPSASTSKLHMKWCMTSCGRPSNRSSRPTFPFGPSNTYGLSIRTIGSRRRSALTRSRVRVSCFSFASSSCGRRATPRAIRPREVSPSSFSVSHLLVVQSVVERVDTRKW